MAIGKLCLAALIIGVSTISTGAVELVNPLQVLEQSRRGNIEFDKRMKRDAAEQRRLAKEQEAKRKKEDAEREKAQEAQQTTAPQRQGGKTQAAQRKPASGSTQRARSSSAKTAPSQPTTGQTPTPTPDQAVPSEQPGQL